MPSSCTNAQTRPPAPGPLGHLGQLVELLARHLARAGVDRPHDAAAAEHGGEDLELRRAQVLGDVGDLQAEARVGPVGAEAQHRLVVAHARVRRRLDVEPADREDLRHEALVDVDDVVLLDERHLEVELRELGLAVGAQVLVAKAARDLEVALVAGDHQQLLEELRRLRQRVERARLQARGHEEVARALGRRLREDRRLDLEEVVVGERLADRAHDLVAQHERVDHRAPAQVQGAVAQAQHLVELDVGVQRKRRRLRLGQQLHLGDLDLDLARREVRVDLASLAADDVAGDADDVLGAQPLGGGEQLGAVLRVEDELHDARAVAQVDEDQAAVVAAVVDPARDRAPALPARSAPRSPAQASRYGLARGADLTACPGRAGRAPRPRPRQRRVARPPACPSAPSCRRPRAQRSERRSDRRA